jgi:elongation factor Ts
MTAISAALVKELRERTGAGMMECKNALAKAGIDGNIEKAIDELRKSGRTKADKKAGRIAAEGMVVVASGHNRTAMLEMNCETDFVGRDENFLRFTNDALQVVLSTGIADLVALAALPMYGNSGKTVEEARQESVAKVGENVQIRRVVVITQTGDAVGTYLHGNRIGVVVLLDVPKLDVARDVAMHIAASRPLVISPDQVSSDLIEKEKEIYAAQAASTGKPQEIVDKMVLGRVKKFLDEVSLLGQPFVKDPSLTVSNLLSQHHAKVLAFHRFEVGEGIEKVVEDFKEAVRSQIQGG